MSLKHALIGLLAFPVAAVAVEEPAAALPLSCPMAAGWRIGRQITLSRAVISGRWVRRS